MEDQRRAAAAKEAASRRATDAQLLEDAERLIAAWNERQEKRMPMLFSPTIGGAIAARYWFLWVRCPACRLANARSPSRRGRDQSHSRAIVPLVSAKRALRRARAIIADKHRRRDARRASPTSARRVIG